MLLSTVVVASLLSNVVGCRVLVLVVGCIWPRSLLIIVKSDVAVDGCCGFLVVECCLFSVVSFDCRMFLSVFVAVYRMSLLMVVVGSWLSDVGGCRSGVGCRLSLSAVAPTLSIVRT